MAAAPAIMLAGSGMQALGALADAYSQAQQLEGQATLSDYNAEISRQNARNALEVSSARQLAFRRSTRQAFGRQRAAAAQSGVGESGQVAALLSQNQSIAELDALNLAYEGMLTARGFTTEAEIEGYRARLARSQATHVRRSAWFRAAGALGGGAAQSGMFSGGGSPTTVGGANYLGGGINPGSSGMGFRTYGGTGLRYG